MEFDRKNLILSLPIFALEIATIANLMAYYQYHEMPFPAFLLAASFSVLLIGTAFMISQDLSTTVRTLLICGGLLLFMVQGASNISEAFLRAQDAMPATRLATLWGASPQDWMKNSSFIWGGIINVVGGIYWLGLSFHYRQERRRDAIASAALQEILRQRR